MLGRLIRPPTRLRLRAPCLRLPLSLSNAAATTAIYTLSLHDALPICALRVGDELVARVAELPGADGMGVLALAGWRPPARDRKSTRLNSSHGSISYAVFCLKKKKKRRGSRLDRRHKHRKSRGELGDEL